MKFTLETLRPYQSWLIDEYRKVGRVGHAVVLQAPTGVGKTAIIGGICELAKRRGKSVWIVVPRNKLVSQTSKHLSKWGISHGIIQGKNNGSSAFSTHVISKDTIVKRIKTHNFKAPDIIIIDECHVAILHQLKLKDAFPEAFLIGLTATPESKTQPMSDVWDQVIYSKPIKWFISAGWLPNVKYYNPGFLDPSQLKGKIGKEYSEKQIEELFNSSQTIYGDVITHYSRKCKGKPAICFCSSVALSKRWAQAFRDAGFRSESIDGTQTDKQVTRILEDFEAGKIDILTNCMIATYGLDLPNAEVCLDLAMTKSRALHLQKIGRILRLLEGCEFKYYFDFVNNTKEHSENGVPLIFLDHVIDFDFEGKKKKNLCDSCEKYMVGKCPKIAYSMNDKHSIIKDTRKLPVHRCKSYKQYKDDRPNKCPACDAMPFDGIKCISCDWEKADINPKKTVVLDTDLQEYNHHLLDSSEIPVEDKRIYQDRIGEFKSMYADGKEENAITELDKIRKSRNYKHTWIYHQLRKQDVKAIQVPLLYQIQRVLELKEGWVWYAKKTLKT